MAAFVRQAGRPDCRCDNEPSAGPHAAHSGGTRQPVPRLSAREHPQVLMRASPSIPPRACLETRHGGGKSVEVAEFRSHGSPESGRPYRG
jgi:hypothetical protein